MAGTRDGSYQLNPSRSEDYALLLRELAHTAAMPTHVLHLWALGNAKADQQVVTHLDRGALSILYFVRALMAHRATLPVPASHTRIVFAHAALDGMGRPEHAATSGLLKSIAQEDSRVQGTVVAVVDQPPGDARLNAVIRELRLPMVGDVLLQGHERSIATLCEAPSIAGHAPMDGLSPFRAGGVYLITGGTGGIGLQIAEYLGRKVSARLVLCARSNPDPSVQKRLDALQRGGAEVLFVRCDVSRQEDVAALVKLRRCDSAA